MCFIWSWRTSRNGYALMKYLIILVSLPIVLIGCSGGGGGGGGVPAANSAPAITAGCSTVSQANALMGMLMATDANGDPISFSLDLANPMMAGPINTANGGSVMLTDTTTGAFTYTPPTQAQGPRGTDSFMFRVDDPTSFSTATETVIVNPKIMPLGDSITEGVSGVAPMDTPSDDRIGYRLTLFNSLLAQGVNIDYVGELDDGVNLMPAGQTANAGYSAAQDQHIADGMFGLFPQLDGIFAELEQNPADIILLHIGSNNINMVDSDPTDVERILTEIRRWEDTGTNPNPVSVYVMQIINQAGIPAGAMGVSQTPAIMARNANVITRIMNPTVPNSFPSPVVFGAELDMFTALGGVMPDPANYGANGDIIHPSAAGYDLMAGVLFDSLTMTSPPTIGLNACP